MTNTIYIVALEPIDSRYTEQWITAIPNEILEANPKANVVTITGDEIGESKTAGAFLDFALTNVWKNSQMNKVAKMFSSGEVKPNDVFLFTDAWHTGVIQTRYMSDLLDIPVKINSVWHAGSYDKTDILGFKIKDKRWSWNFERSAFHASDMNWFGSKYHKELFCDVLNVPREKAFHSGQPHSQILSAAEEIPRKDKKNIVLFGHRISPDKQPEIFEDLAKEFPDYDFVFSQKLNLSKADYYKLIRESKLSFSANLHENFGISMIEAIFNGTPILVPSRLSYNEMYFEDFIYDTEWTKNFESYLIHKQSLVARIRDILENPPSEKTFDRQKDFLIENYMTAKKMVKGILS